ncbi:fungal-specific transcription factor domain-containing protein [Roridomyces roridus]|uniref:Fungal-specific transcription factor domain-containing protein n=1 Tax=Roridomyces roridus TaxID=1738132 RepID=A0AAD7CBJ1_9AGAR|nr:fungal-specific transcription factor domain-containing protein [Roridomyces roridus]
MSSESPSPPPDLPSSAKQRRSARSCDGCRHRKIRCDGPTKPEGAQCSNCLPFNSPCTYLQPSKKRGPKTKSVEELKQRIAVLEAKLREPSVCALCSRPLETSSLSMFHHSPESDTLSESSSDDPPPVEDTFSQDELAKRFSQISLKGKHRFFGPGSSFSLVINTMAAKEKVLGHSILPIGLTKRPRFFDTTPWEQEVYDRRPHYEYPPHDLMAALIDLYFAYVHPTLPVLHEPTFRRDVILGLHLKDIKFGATLLAVLALGSWWSDDPRVFSGGPGDTLSAGWKFASQVQLIDRPFEPTMYEVQSHSLMALYSLATSAPQMSWLWVGLGVRFLQQRGEHLKKRRPVTTIEDELWNRAFWSLFVLDRLICNFLGRATTIIDFDVDPPLEVDDEYWESGFTQPLGKPSRLSFWVHFVQLSEILGDALRELYASNRWKTRMGWTGAKWESEAVAKLDSAMNSFLTSLPPHLRWDADRPPGVFFEQSATLHVTYFHIQITIHRQHIHKPSALAGPSLSLCTAAARSALAVGEAWINKTNRIALIFYHNSLFAAASTLLLNMYARQRANLPVNRAKDMELIGSALRILKISEARCQPAGRLWEILVDLQCLKPSHAITCPNASHSAAAERHRAVPSDPTPSALTQYPASNNAGQFYQQPEQGETFGPGTSIEQLLAGTTPELGQWPASSENGIFDDEMMSLWMAAPTDFSNLGQWDMLLVLACTFGHAAAIEAKSPKPATEAAACNWFVPCDPALQASGQCEC